MKAINFFRLKIQVLVNEKPEKENQPSNKLQNTSTEPLPLHHCWYPFATILFLLAQENVDHKPTLAPLYPFHSSTTCPPGGNMSSRIIASPEVGAGMQNVDSSSHAMPLTSSNPGQHPAKGNYLESQNPQNNTCMDCHLLDLNLFLSQTFYRDFMAKPVPAYLLFGAQDITLRVRSSNWS